MEKLRRRGSKITKKTCRLCFGLQERKILSLKDGAFGLKHHQNLSLDAQSCVIGNLFYVLI
jgi:hypothetical protein